MKCACPNDKKLDPIQAGDLESTAWAILCLAQAGYTELSSDAISGRKVADAVRSGLDWLVSKQAKDGAFEGAEASAGALASLALIEIHGITLRRKDAAERAYQWVAKAAPLDVPGLVHVGMAIESAKLDEMGGGRGPAPLRVRCPR